LRYIGLLMIAAIFSGTIALLYALLFNGEGNDGSILLMVVITHNIVIVLLLVYVIDLMKKARSIR